MRGIMRLLTTLLALSPALLCAADAPAKPVGKPIRIGAILAVTGPASNLGAPEEKTARMLIEKLNASGGLLGRPVELVVKDSGGSPEKAVSFAKQLIEEEKVLAIVGPSTSGETMAIKSLCEEAGMILVSCAAAEVIVNPQAKYVFKTPQKDSQAATWIFKTMKAQGIGKIAVLSDNSGFGKAGKDQLEKLAPEQGLTVVASEVYDKAATDLTDILTKVKASGAEAVVNWSIVPAQSILAKNMRQMGMTVPLFQSHGFGNIKYVEAAGKAAEGILFPCGRLLVVDALPETHPQKAVLAAYKKDYEAAYKEDVSTFGGHGYDAVLFVVEGVKKAGTDDRAKVRDAIESLTNLPGTAGVFNLSATDHNGLGLEAFEMLTVKDGRFTIYRP
jgi:branched-chain amino acid transport system substrate-binding protein